MIGNEKKNKWERIENLCDIYSPIFAFFLPLITIYIIGFISSSLYYLKIANLADPAWQILSLWIITGYFMIPCKHRKYHVFSWGGFGYLIGFIIGLSGAPLYGWVLRGPYFFLPVMILSALFTFIFCTWHRRKEENKPFWNIVLLGT